MDVPLTRLAAPALPDHADVTTSARETALREVAEAFEAAFLAEMLRQSGINAAPEGFGGGAGEAAFSSFLTEEYARLLSARGGIGLAEHVFEMLKQREGAP
jgi:flagellar protein FlgJ